MGRRAHKPNPTGSTGNTRMRDLGKKSLTVWVTAGEKSIIESAARKQGTRTATWIRDIALEAAGGLFPPNFRE